MYACVGIAITSIYYMHLEISLNFLHAVLNESLPGSAMMFKSGYFVEQKCLFNASAIAMLKLSKSVSVSFCPGNPPPMSSRVKR
jgi:hypothetical protein